MPFTVSHVAAILPLARTPLAGSALAIGSMSPDFPYYLPVPLPPTHNLLAMVTLDPLLGLVAFVLWHAVLAEPALAVAPAGLRARLPVAAMAPVSARLAWPRPLLVVLGSLGIGAATHLFWDAFTHRGRWGANHISWLAADHGPFPGYRWGQYASGVFGAVVIAVWLVHWWRTTSAVEPRLATAGAAIPALPTTVRVRAALAVSAGAAAGAIFGIARLLAEPGPTDASTLAFVVLTRGIAGAASVALVLAVAWQVRARRRDSAGHPGPPAASS